jgi:hypothetical protein
MFFFMLEIIQVLSLSKPVPSIQEVILIDPVPREGTSSWKIDSSPCGGASKGLSHSLIDPDSYHPITWTTLTPSQGANCTVRLLYSDTSFQVLPLYNEKSENGWFACGRRASQYETVSIIIPKQVKCSDCTFQFIFKTFQGASYQCADVSINPSAHQSCKGKCKNKGSCEDNLCICAKGFVGTFCEISNESEEGSSNLGTFFVFLVLLIVASVLLALIFYWKYPERVSEAAKSIMSRISIGSVGDYQRGRHEHIAVDINRESSSSSDRG